ncbi:MAG TPA: NAD(P)-binding domain-containing protein [Actinomycetaceae bacterium]|nr:NAD(P)-binding domain-containing protein [Actinomycetaceae bacterium]
MPATPEPVSEAARETQPTHAVAAPRAPRVGGPTGEARRVSVVVIGAGQAGLSAAYHLRRRGLADSRGADAGRGSFVVLDAEEGPGGAWRHRWETLRMATVNGIYDLPGMAQPDVDPEESAREAVPRYFADYERHLDLAVQRPVAVRAVRPVDDDPSGPLLVVSDAGQWLTDAVVNATGTWRKPFWPNYPGQTTFGGQQLHTADYRSAEDFRGKHVVIVGGGISALEHLDEISRVTTTTWVTRRPPVFRDGEFGPEQGREAVAMVERRVADGLPPESVVSVTGLIWTPWLRAAAEREVLRRLPMFERVERDGVRWADGTFQPVDVILWATGFRAQLDHLRPLRLRARGGGIAMSGTRVVAEPRVHLVGYGPSASTVGANRAGRAAAVELLGWLEVDDAVSAPARA